MYKSSTAAALALALVLVGAPAHAQQPAPEPAPPGPAPDLRAPRAPQPQQTPQAGPVPEPAPPGDVPGADDPDIAVLHKDGDPLELAMAPQPGGWTLEQVADRAAEVDFEAKAIYAEMRASAARVDQALAAYFPRLSVMASYTRLSPVRNTIDFDIPGAPPSAQSDIEFPVILNQYLIVGSLEVPLSDYLLRLSQAYATVSLDRDAKRLEMRAREAQAAADAQVTFLNWLRAKGQVAVAEMAVDQAKAHVGTAKVTLSAGVIARGDVLRLEAQQAQAEHLLLQARSFEALAADQLRIMLRLEPNEPITSGVDVVAAPDEIELLDVSEYQRLALSRRLELASLDKAQGSLEARRDATEGSYAPRVAAFGNLTYANPNPRIFPQQERWDLTWDVGVRLTWTLNDAFTTVGAANEIQAQVDSVKMRRAALENGVRVTVLSAYNEVGIARSALTAARLREEAAEGALKDRLTLFRNGRATATHIVDNETELTQSRLQRVDAHIDLLTAIVKLEHAIGGPPLPLASRTPAPAGDAAPTTPPGAD